MSQSTFRSDIFCPQDGNPREQINGITAFIDGSNIYGSTEEIAIGLRADETFETETFPGARLRTQISQHTTSRGHKALPSRRQCRFASPQPTPENRNPNPTPNDLTSGDTRAVVQPTLTSIHTLFVQEHNRIVDAVTKLWETNTVTKSLSPRTKADFIFEVKKSLVVYLKSKLKYFSLYICNNWCKYEGYKFQFVFRSDTDTKIFPQLARRLVGAQLQQITYREFLPVVLGKKALGNLASIETTYDQNVDPSILNEFATVAFRLSFDVIGKNKFLVRFGHSIIHDSFDGEVPWLLKDHFFE